MQPGAIKIFEVLGQGSDLERQMWFCLSFFWQSGQRMKVQL
jgi:hypothetical protein